MFRLIYRRLWDGIPYKEEVILEHPDFNVVDKANSTSDYWEKYPTSTIDVIDFEQLVNGAWRNVPIIVEILDVDGSWITANDVGCWDPDIHAGRVMGIFKGTRRVYRQPMKVI